MLDFSFTPAEEEFRAALRTLALGELLPRYRAGDATGTYPREQIRRVIAFVDEFWRGRDADRTLVVSGIIAEEVARGDFNCVLPSLGPALNREFLAAASPELCARWVPGLLAGDLVLGLCLTEAEAGSDMGAIRTSAERRGDVYVLNGEKTSVSFLNADVFYVFARTDPTSADWRGLSAFLVSADTPGLTTEPYDDMGCRAVPRGILRLANVEVPTAAIVGFQGVAFPIAEAATVLELARWQCYRVLWMRERGIACAAEGAMVKWWATKVAAEAIHQCLLLHGHLGYTKRLPIEQRLRDVIGWQIGDGAPQIQKLIIARTLFGKDVLPR